MSVVEKGAPEKSGTLLLSEHLLSYLETNNLLPTLFFFNINTEKKIHHLKG
jgi:hypothetical protein